MKTALFFVAATMCLQAQAQFPYFLQEHNGNNINYGVPVDIEFDGSSTVYSLHGNGSGPGMIAVKYDASTGSLIDVSHITRGNAFQKPVRVHTLGGNYYVLFNATSALGVSGYCLVSLNASTNVVNWAQAFSPPTGGAFRNAVDFVLDGGSYAYILTSAYDAVNNQNDVGVTKVDISSPALIWDNIYQNTTRNDYPYNIVYRSTTAEIAVSAMSSDLANPSTDRGPALIRISTGGGYLASMLYKYTPGCNNAEPEGTWVVPGPNNFYLSSTSTESGANGPLWLAKINPASLTINIQTNHRTGSAYLRPEIQGVLATTGNQVLISGSSPSSSGYVHLEFATSSLAFSQGVVYPGTNPQPYSPIYDVYIATAIGMNIFSIADNVAALYHYYLLKTSDLGNNGCDVPYPVTQDQCGMKEHTISFTQVPVSLLYGAPSITVANHSNTIIQPCYVPMRPAMTDKSLEIESSISQEISIFPNPTKGIFTLSAGKSTLSDVKVYTAAGTAVRADLIETADGVSINLSGKKPGIYLVQLHMDGEPKTLRVVLE